MAQDAIVRTETETTVLVEGKNVMTVPQCSVPEAESLYRTMFKAWSNKTAAEYHKLVDECHAVLNFFGWVADHPARTRS